MELYKLLSETEKKASKALDIRNVYVKDLTITELSQLSDILTYTYESDENEIGWIRAGREIQSRQGNLQVL